jgi:hypothetical protein
MKKYFLISLTILSVNVYSQKGFYLRPLLENKINANGDIPYEVKTAQGYVVKVTPLRFYGEHWYDLGLYMGYRTKKYFFETGWSPDGGNEGIRLSASTLNPLDSSFYNFTEKETMGASFNKFPLRIGVKIFGKDTVLAGKTLRWQGFLYGGLDVLTRPPINAEVGGGDVFVIDKLGHTVEYESRLRSNQRYTQLRTIGFMLKGYNKKGRSVVNFSVHFSQGLRSLYTTYMEIKFTNYDGTIYKSFVSSKSSGLYFSLSKDIYPKNWFKKKEQLEYYRKK